CQFRICPNNSGHHESHHGQGYRVFSAYFSVGPLWAGRQQTCSSPLGSTKSVEWLPTYTKKSFCPESKRIGSSLMNLPVLGSKYRALENCRMVSVSKSRPVKRNGFTSEPLDAV